MKFFKEVKLKNGSECIIRNAIEADASEVLEHLKHISAETEEMTRYPDEYTITEKEERKFIKSMEASPNAILIVAELEGKIVGTASLWRLSGFEKFLHRSGFGVGIQKAHWGYGIGNHIMGVIIESAKNAGYEQIELEVSTNNDRAVSLYKKFGFEIFGTNKWFSKTRDGKYQEMYYMLLRL